MKTNKKKVAPKKKSAKAKAKPKATLVKARASPKARATAKRAKAKSAQTASRKKTGTKKSRQRPGSKKGRPKKAGKKPAGAIGVKRWLDFVEKHGVVLASAKGPVPSLAENIVGEPIVGSWWSHPKGNEIFEILSAIDEDVDVRCFKLVDGKVTFVHRRVWPALVRLARDGVLPPGRVESVHQEHTETGQHRNFNVAFPEWVPDDVAKAADGLTTEAARDELGSWVGA